MRDLIAGTVAQLPKRAEPEKALVRVVALLRQYFQTDTAQSVIEVEAEDWADALSPFPDWAIRRACRWWQGADNPNRKRKPMIGDIVEICRNETGALDMAKKRLSDFDFAGAKRLPLPKGERVSPARAAQIMREVYGADRAADAIGNPKKFPTTGETA